MLKMVFNPLQLLGVIILNLRTVFNNKILVHFQSEYFALQYFTFWLFSPGTPGSRQCVLPLWQVLKST